MKELKDGVEFFDGEPVGYYEGRFSGVFELEQDAAALSCGDQVTFIVTARLDSPKFGRVRKSGELKRTNSLKVESVTQVSKDRAMYMLDSVGVKVFGVNDGIIEATPEPAPELSSFNDEVEVQSELVAVEAFQERGSVVRQQFLSHFTKVS